MAGLTADECVYLESDATFRSVKPKRKDATPYAPKAQVTKLSRTISTQATDPNVVVRCSRCIRTARGCSHERPCQPCREHGLSEWECRYTSASSFKVRGPGARDLRKVKSLERIPTTLKSGFAALAEAEDEDDEDFLTRPLQKQARSLSTNSVKNPRVQILVDRTPRDYRTPSPPTNVSPISEPSGWKDSHREPSVSSGEDGTTPRTAVPIPGSRHKFALTMENDATSMSDNNDNDNISTTVIPAGSVEPPPMMTLIPSVSQQSHANTIPESSPAVYTDDYQSSPSPYNSPPFQSSPPIHFHTIGGIRRLPPYTGNESSMFSPQPSYRTPAGYSPTSANPGQYVLSQTQHGFLVPQHSQAHMQSYNQFSVSPPYPRYVQSSEQHFAAQTTPTFYQHNQQHSQQLPRSRIGPGPTSHHMTNMGKQYDGSVQTQMQSQSRPSGTEVRQQGQAQAQTIPVRGAGSSQHGYYSTYGISTSEGSTPPLTHFQEPKDGVARESQALALARASTISKQRQVHQSRPQQPDQQDFDHGMYEQEMAWQDTESNVTGQ